MKTKNILHIFLGINIASASNIFTMEKPVTSQRVCLSELTIPVTQAMFSSGLPLELRLQIVEIMQREFNRNNASLLNAIRSSVKDVNENEIQELLNQCYINVNIKDHSGNTPLTLAIKNNNPKIVKMLLDAHANPDIQDSLDETPLILAVKKNDLEIVQMLLYANVELNMRDSTSRSTALIWAVTKNNPEIVRILLNAGADRTFKNSYGKTALDIAQHRIFNIYGNKAALDRQENNRQEIIRLLKHKPYNF